MSAKEKKGKGTRASSIAVFLAPRDHDFQLHQSTHSLPSSSMSSFFWHPVEGYAMLSCYLVVVMEEEKRKKVVSREVRSIPSSSLAAAGGGDGCPPFPASRFHQASLASA